MSTTSPLTGDPARPDPRSLVVGDFPVVRPVTTRWSDNDMYGHLNNAVYYELFDSAINGWHAENLTLDPTTDPSQGVVAESGCAFYGEVAFPQPLVVALAVDRLGTSSVVYRLGLFLDPAHSDDPAIKALGHWVHVEIDAVTRRPTPIPEALRALLLTAVRP